MAHIADIYKEVDLVTGEFIPNGHVIMGNSLKQFQVPYELLGDTLTVDMPAGYYGEPQPAHTISYKAQ